MKQITMQQFQNQRQSSVNQKLKEEVQKLWSSVIVPKTDPNFLTISKEDALLKIDYYHITADLKSNTVFINTKYPEKGASFIIFTTASGSKYVTYSICSKEEKLFNKKLGIFYALKSALKSGVLPVSLLFANVNFKQLIGNNKITENELIVKNLSYWLATEINPLMKKQAPLNYKTAETSLFKTISNKFLEDTNVEVRYQFIQIRKALLDTKPIVATTSYLAKNKENTVVSPVGGLTIFMVTATHKETGKSFVVTSEAICSAKDVFDKTTGRYFALLKMAKESGYVINLEDKDTDFESVISFYSELINQPIIYKTTHSS